jgi:hypothetical protein
VVNYNFFPPFGVCKLLVGVYSSSGLSPQGAGLMGKKQDHHLALQEVNRATTALPDGKRDGKRGFKPVAWWEKHEWGHF